MFSAKKSLVVLAALGTLMFLAAPAVADWAPGDGHKMHYPQLPDPDGWDVDFSAQQWVGDDWRCTETGPVSDIHFWVSFKGYNGTTPPTFPAGGSLGFTVAIFSNNPDGGSGYSVPGYMEWLKLNTSYSIRYAGSGDQGWYSYGTTVPHDHTSYFQINIEDISSPFRQEKDNIYWLLIQSSATSPMAGWKTSGSQHFIDDAVVGAEPSSWWEISIEGESRDLAFVITIPEPGTLVLLITAGFGLLLFAWRRQNPERR